MGTPRVTIITPCYNQERFIGPCIDSVLHQSFQDWEQIVVDDGSTDDTLSIVERYDDPRIRLLRMPHRGLGKLAESYNAALSAAAGDIVAILEGDDMWPADKLAAQVPAFDAGEVFLIWGRGLAVDEEGRTVRPLTTLGTSEPFVDLDAPHLFERLVRTNIVAPAASVMVRRGALEAIGGFQQAGSAHYVDLATWLALAARTGGRARFLNRTLALYRVHAAQATQRFGDHMEAEHANVVSEVVARLDAAALKRLRWDRLRASAAAAGLLARGRVELAQSRHGSALRTFARAFARADHPRDWFKASLGVLSAVTHVDLLTRLLFARRDVIGGASGRLGPKQ